VGNFVAVLLQIYISICVPKIIEIVWFDKVIAKIKGVQFFGPTVYFTEKCEHGGKWKCC